MNTKILMLLVFIFQAKITFAQHPFDPIEAEYKLVWEERFEKDGLVNPLNWTFEEGFVRNRELQWYQASNAKVSNGVLVITGKKEQVKNPNYDSESKDWKRQREFANYSSSSIHTKGKFDFKYGILEVRAKIDTALGMWPAIWTLGISRLWPSNGEIDLMEYYRVRGEATILANAAWADEGEYNPKWDEMKIPFSNFLEKDSNWPSKFHYWRMEWTEESIKLFLDDELLNEIDLGRTINADGSNPFHQPHYILLNLAIGGNGGDPSNTTFPKQYLVDYVKVYQKK